MGVRKTINDLIMEYFKAHPNEKLSHGPVVDYVTEEYRKLYGEPPRDPWRAIRRLHQEGKLVKVRHGIYKYDLSYVHKAPTWDFPDHVKQQILEKDNYRCVVCGRGREDGVEIHVDHIKPRDKGGTNTVDNGQILCSEHNYLKKNYSQTEAGKRYFIKLYQDAISAKDKRIVKFCQTIFDTYNDFNINSHIPRPNKANHKSGNPINYQKIYYSQKLRIPPFQQNISQIWA